jgi:cysteine desulfurase / selenocysteine lyase
LTSGGTEAFNFIQNSFALKFLKKNDCILLTALEHHSNIIPWIITSIRLKLNIKFIGICSSGRVNFKKFIKNLTPNVKLISIAHVSNLLGIINPVNTFSNISNVLNIPILIDGTQFVVHSAAQVIKYKCDFYIFSSHKILSSFGTGVLYIKDI